MSRSHLFSYDPLLFFQSWSICTHLITTRLHLFNPNSFTSFLFDLFTFLWSRSICNFLVTTHSQHFGHNHLHTLVTFYLHFYLSRSITVLTTICTFLVTIHLHHFGHFHDIFTPFRLRFKILYLYFYVIFNQSKL